MARAIDRLSAVHLTKKRPGMHCDGLGLYLQVTVSGARSWIYRYKIGKHARDMGLGSLEEVSLAEAREKAAEARRLVRDGIDPIEHRKSSRAAQRLAEARGKTFRQAAEEYVSDHEAEWRNEKHRAQWRSTLKTYAYPIIGDLAVSEITTQDVHAVLSPIWNDKPETASRVRGRIETIINAARADDDSRWSNPARWERHKHRLPKRSKIAPTHHHAALSYAELPAFMADLRKRQGITPRALEFVILNVARTSEAIGGLWAEADFEARVWTVPASRMKAGRPHRVPLAKRSIAILTELRALRQNEFIFPGVKPDSPLSNMAMLMLLREMRPGLTVHGFRSTFKDWCAEATSVPNFVSEAALAHVVADKVEAAYRRGELFVKRRELMEAWTEFCERRRTSSPRHRIEKTRKTRDRTNLPIPKPIPIEATP